MNRFVIFFPIFLLSGCGGAASSPQTTTTICLNNAAAISVLADLHKAGKLSPVIVTTINTDIALTDSVCSDPTGKTPLSAAASIAISELASLAASGGK